MKLTYQQDSFKLDASRVTDETHSIFGDMTVFHDVVIASEIVQPYEDGRAWKSRDELEAYAWTVDGRWVMVGSHPNDGIISERDQVSGRTINPRYVKDLKDPVTKRPCRAGVRADIQIFNNKIQPQLLADMKDGKKADVSIGFFFNKDDTPGVVESDSCKGQEYDYVQRNMFHDHLAAGIDNGRCTMPYCGLGADEIIKKLTGDPFAGYKDFAACKADIATKNPDLSDEAVEKICGKLKSEHEDTVMEDAILGKSKEHMLLLLEEAYEELRGTVLAKKEAVEGDWWRRLDWTETENRTLYDSLNEETRVLITEAGLCPDCVDAPRSEAERAMSHFNISKEDWSKLSDEEKQNYIKKLPERGSGDAEECEEGYEKNEEGECVKKEEEAGDVKESNPGFHNKGESAEGECPEGMEWNAEKKKCVEIADFSDRPENKKVDKLDPYEVLKRANAVL